MKYMSLALSSPGSLGEGVIKIVYILFLCVIVFLGAYYTSRLVGQHQFNRKKHGNIRIIEAIYVGPQKSIQLVQVGSEYLLIGVTKDRIQYMKEIDKDHIDFGLYNQLDSKDPISFSQHLDKLMKKNPFKKDQD